jgi:DNA-binding response OmpR family regulator
MAASILIVEDDENLRLALADNLESEGHRVVTAADGAEADARLAADTFDLLVLDVMLPDGDGYEICRRIRAAGSEARVLMLTARSLEEDVVRGFDVGADDYLAKPYRLKELLARVRALLRRRVGGTAAGIGAFSFAGFHLDLEGRSLKGPDDRPIDLTRTEFDLLAFLVRNRDRALDRQGILDAVWGEDVVVDGRTVDNFVSNLKKKLGWSAQSAFRIRTIRGVGYRMEIDEG